MVKLLVTPSRLASPRRIRTHAEWNVHTHIAFTIGPTGVAMISDYWLKDSAKIGVAIGMLTLIMLPLGLLALWAARSEFRQIVGAAEPAEGT
mgnify:CR=1 FL=1